MRSFMAATTEGFSVTDSKRERRERGYLFMTELTCNNKDPVSFIKITTRPPGGRATTLIFIKISARHWPPAACRELKRCLYDLDIAQPDANTT